MDRYGDKYIMVLVLVLVLDMMVMGLMWIGMVISISW